MRDYSDQVNYSRKPLLNAGALLHCWVTQRRRPEVDKRHHSLLSGCVDSVPLPPPCDHDGPCPLEN